MSKHAFVLAFIIINLLVASSLTIFFRENKDYGKDVGTTCSETDSNESAQYKIEVNVDEGG